MIIGGQYLGLFQKGKAIFSKITVKLVLRGHQREGQKIAAKNRRPLNTGSITLYFCSRTGKCGCLRQVIP